MFMEIRLSPPCTNPHCASTLIFKSRVKVEVPLLGCYSTRVSSTDTDSVGHMYSVYLLRLTRNSAKLRTVRDERMQTLSNGICNIYKQYIARGIS